MTMVRSNRTRCPEPEAKENISTVHLASIDNVLFFNIKAKTINPAKIESGTDVEAIINNEVNPIDQRTNFPLLSINFCK